MTERHWIVVDIDQHRNCVTVHTHTGDQRTFRLRKPRMLSRHFLSPEQARQAVAGLANASKELEALVTDD